jgi:aspartate kinase
MQVWKFGGTSVGKPERMQSIARLVTQNETQKVVVLSAVSGTTNSLLAIANFANNGNLDAANSAINTLYSSYLPFIKELFATEKYHDKGLAILDKEFDNVKKSIAANPFTDKQEKEIAAEGELISTQLFQTYLEEIDVDAVLIPALDFMKIDEEDEPMLDFIEQKLKQMASLYQSKHIIVTQGYICRNINGEIDNLKRGGSDYTASLVGAAMRSEEVQIWTDIDGMHNNDPRIVKKTYPVRELSFDEAAELAYFGAKILHPTCIRPAQKYNIPVRLLNTMQPEAPGTLISNKSAEDRIFTAVAAKDNIVEVHIRSTYMLMAYGFLRKVFEIFEKYRTSVDMITTSEVSVTLTIDNPANLDNIVKMLSVFSHVEIAKDTTTICIVGNFKIDKPGVVAKVLDTLKEIPLRMISYGGSEHNVSILVDSEYKNQVLTLLNTGLFGME